MACFVVVAVAVGGCSSDDDDTVPSAATAAPMTTHVASSTIDQPTSIPATTPTTMPTTTPITTPPTSPTVSSNPGVTSPPTTASPTDPPGDLRAADLDAVTAAFLTFFGGLDSTTDEKLAVLEGAEIYREMLEAASENAQFKQMSTDIREIRAGSDDECGELAAAPRCAIVVHDVLIGGFPMAAGIVSPAVRSDGGWLVGWRAWCNIVEIGGETCPEPADG